MQDTIGSRPAQIATSAILQAVSVDKHNDSKKMTGAYSSLSSVFAWSSLSKEKCWRPYWVGERLFILD